MGYTFTIGNAKPAFSKDDFPYLSARWECEAAHSDDAPTFENDELTGNTNKRHPSYSVWADFCRDTGLYSMFFDDRGNLHAGHPGCYGLTAADGETVAAALAAYRLRATRPPGFSAWFSNHNPNRDATLARLIWLDFWVRWALENCETPAISNI